MHVDAIVLIEQDCRPSKDGLEDGDQNVSGKNHRLRLAQWVPLPHRLQVIATDTHAEWHDQLNKAQAVQAHRCQSSIIGPDNKDAHSEALAEGVPEVKNQDDSVLETAQLRVALGAHRVQSSIPDRKINSGREQNKGDPEGRRTVPKDTGIAVAHHPSDRVVCELLRLENPCDDRADSHGQEQDFRVCSQHHSGMYQALMVLQRESKL
mmetsp:Transcript_32624/g.52487  ORF Transcript_32624/g.52487 Transcript_32624/m.52487 type:complete len:208 (-) Transcript_32624:22-645(-)